MCQAPETYSNQETKTGRPRQKLVCRDLFQKLSRRFKFLLLPVYFIFFFLSFSCEQFHFAAVGFSLCATWRARPVPSVMEVCPPANARREQRHLPFAETLLCTLLATCQKQSVTFLCAVTTAEEKKKLFLCHLPVTNTTLKIKSWYFHSWHNRMSELSCNKTSPDSFWK